MACLRGARVWMCHKMCVCKGNIRKNGCLLLTLKYGALSIVTSDRGSRYGLETSDRGSSYGLEIGSVFKSILA